ncbi:MAG TPA: hypothetical protein VK858_19915, partial [Longimicrobiales bacterium]|nr:hypothetical protein [Longimicrobiales bacterium]
SHAPAGEHADRFAATRRRSGTPGAAPTPFQRDEYRLRVLFASVLFLTGLAQTAKNRGPRAALLSLSFLLFLGGAYGLLVLPRL